MTRYAIQFIVGRRPAGVDEADLPWQDIDGHDNYETDAEAWANADEFDSAFDHRYTHRVVRVETEDDEVDEVTEPALTLPPPPPPAPATRKVQLRSQLVSHQAGLAFERNRDLLKSWLELDTPRAFLDSLVELCTVYLAQCSPSVRTTSYANQLVALKARVETKGNLRLVR